MKIGGLKLMEKRNDFWKGIAKEAKLTAKNATRKVSQWGIYQPEEPREHLKKEEIIEENKEL